MSIRDILIEQIDQNLPEKECAVLLSGGVDIISIGLSAHYLNKPIHGYSFQLEGNPSYDFSKAEEVCDTMGWNFTGIEIPTDKLADDFHRLLDFGCERKTHFECVYPFLHVYPEIKEECVLSGWGADSYYGLSRSALDTQKGNVQTTKERLDQFRERFFQPEECAGYLWHKKVSDHWNKKLITPYLSEPVREFLDQFDWFELNRPTQKHHVRTSFDEFDTIKVNQHSNLQIESGIDHLFETLLNDPEINFLRRTRMLDVYRDWVNKSSQGSLNEFTIGRPHESSF
ncbi:MAG: hypothetical protein CBD27_12135 [Rhodospirillaceae bacterium TMED167]|nr:hypothetical protein [Rhodospirillaceae bacterium]OUW23573.1 MAG: hypothetical protein CBD27_12135 [Rhodospirillaceae bacterium TMED167]